MRKTLISVLIGFAVLFWSFGSVYGLSAGSELVRTGSRNERNSLTPSTNSAADELPACGRTRLAVASVWRIGAFLPLTGPYAGIGLRFRHGLELALAAEKIAVYPWQLDFIDSAEISPAAGPDETGSALPNYPFSALVIADFRPRLRLIAPQLAFFGVERPQLYAISRGSELDFAREPDGNLDGIIFLDSCFHAPQPSNLLANYKKLYLSSYKQPASIYDAYAYDTIRLLARARQAKAGGGRVDLVAALLELPSLELLTGITTVTVEGVFAKELCPVTYNSGKLLQVK